MFCGHFTVAEKKIDSWTVSGGVNLIFHKFKKNQFLNSNR